VYINNTPKIVDSFTKINYDSPEDCKIAN